MGEEKDLAQHRGDALGFVRSAALEQYLNDTRQKVLAASGKTGVPGRVIILANPGFEAFSSPDGHVYLAMGLLESLESADEVAAIIAHEISHVLLKHHSSDLLGDVQRRYRPVGAAPPVGGHEIGRSHRTAAPRATHRYAHVNYVRPPGGCRQGNRETGPSGGSTRASLFHWRLPR